MGSGAKVFALIGLAGIGGLIYKATRPPSFHWKGPQYFDGAKVLAFPGRNIGPKFTVKAVFRPDNVTSRGTVVSCFSSNFPGGWPGFGYVLWVYEGGELLFAIGDRQNYQYTSPRPKLKAGVTVRAAVVVDGQSLRTFIDGIEVVAPTTQVISPIALPDPITIGAVQTSPGVYSEHFTGEIMRVDVTPGADSPEQIMADAAKAYELA